MITGDQAQVIWAKLTGFPNWPGRYCTIFEEQDLKTRVPAKENQVAVVFFERKIKKAWVNVNSIERFTVSNLFCGDGAELFSPKTFEANSNYRLAIMEAVRILHPSLQDVTSTATLDNGLLLVLKLIRKYEPNFPTKTLDDKMYRQVDVHGCEICYGTFCSGELRNCCNVTETENETENSQDGAAETSTTSARRCGGKSRVHYHCLQPSGGVDINERWFCTNCCKSFGWLPGRILPADDSLVPFFGVVDRFLPPSGESQHDQLYHVTFEDGDGEEYFENELHEVMTLYDEYRGEGYNFPFRSALITDSREWRRPSGTGKSGAKQWTKLHPSVGIRVCKYFTGSLSMLSGSGSGVSDSGAYGGGDGTNVAEDSSKVEHDIQDYMEEAMAFQAAEMGVSQEGAATATIAFSSVPPLPDLRSVSSALPPASVRTLGSTYTSSTSGSVHTYDSTSASLFSSSTEASTATSTVALSAQVNAGSGAGAGVRAVSIADFFRGVPTHGLTARPGGASNPAAPGGNVSASVTGKRSALVLDNLPPPAPPAAATESKREIYLREQQAVKRKMMEVQSAKKGRFNWSTLPIPASPPSSSATASAPTSSATDGATPAAANRKQNVIKKKKAAETDTEDAVPVSVPGPVRNTAPVRANTKCVNAANTQMVTFIDECLSIMQRHRSTMEAAKQNALNSCQVVPQEFANKLVEAMAGDIILVVSQSLNPKSSTSSSSGGGAGKETRES